MPLAEAEDFPPCFAFPFLSAVNKKPPFVLLFLQLMLDSYHILYFKNISVKNQELASYALFEDTIRRRDINKLPLNNYRIIPNISNVVDDLLNLLDYCNPYLHIKSLR